MFQREEIGMTQSEWLGRTRRRRRISLESPIQGAKTSRVMVTAFMPLAGGRRALLFLFLQLVLAFLVESYSSEEKSGIINLHQSLTEHGGSGGEKPPCTVDDLLPDYELEDDLSLNWMHNHLVQPPFDCACRALKASYFCPSLDHVNYPKWVPRKVAKGECRAVPRNYLKHQPFPPGFKMLFYGNSHLRQVVEGIVCMYYDHVKMREVSLNHGDSIEHGITVSNDFQCRSCESHTLMLQHALLANKCVHTSAAEACKCSDDEGVFEFENGAVVHFHFAHKEEGKRIENGLQAHGTSFSDYDAIVANTGNEPRMETREVVRVAAMLKDEGIPLFWMSTYLGEGDIRDWTEEEREAFKSSGARFVPIDDIMESLTNLTRGVVEGEINHHFCMPGPPNEIGILLLKAAWALHARKKRGD